MVVLITYNIIFCLMSLVFTLGTSGYTRDREEGNQPSVFNAIRLYKGQNKDPQKFVVFLVDKKEN